MKKALAITVILLGALAAAAMGYRAYLVSELRQHVLVHLADPDAAQFRNTRLVGDWNPRGMVMCGEVNARNALGGYAGHRKYVVMGDSYFHIDDEQLVNSMCSVLDDPMPWWYFRG